jgi:ribosome maturation factor RimP
MAQSSIEVELKERLQDIARSVSCELLHVDSRGGVLRLVLDRAEGVTLDDCARVSRLASALLDAEDFGDRRYVLEVSSPGLDRELYGPQDYARFLGRSVRVTFSDPDSGRKQTVSGRLDAWDEDRGGAAIVTAADTGVEHVIPLDSIRRAKLEIEL